MVTEKEVLKKQVLQNPADKNIRFMDFCSHKNSPSK